MEDFLFPMHMRRKIGIGDVAIRDKKVAGSLIFQKTSVIRPNEAKKNALILFAGGGTGFIISKSEIFIGEKRKQLAIVLTAGHVVCNVETLEPYENFFSCNLEDREPGIAYFIRNYMKDSPDEHKSIFTDGYYCLTGNLAILLLVVPDNAKINAYRIARKSKVKLDAACIVSGYPCMPHNIRYCIPQLEALTKNEIENEARNIFCNFNAKVYAEGKIENFDNGIIEVSCSTTNGMSGSPIILNRKAVGVYVGGPPVQGQRECIKILQRLKREENPCEIFEDLKKLVSFDPFFTTPIFTKILNGKCVRRFELFGRVITRGLLTDEEKKEMIKINDVLAEFEDSANTLSSKLYDSIYTAVNRYKDKEKFQANFGFLIHHGAFRKSIKKITGQFSLVSRAQTIEDLIDFLRV